MNESKMNTYNVINHASGDIDGIVTSSGGGGGPQMAIILDCIHFLRFVL